MGKKTERLNSKVELAGFRVRIPPYIRSKGGKIEQVDGYWRTITSFGDLKPEEAAAAMRSPDKGGIPQELLNKATPGQKAVVNAEVQKQRKVSPQAPLKSARERGGVASGNLDIPPKKKTVARLEGKINEPKKREPATPGQLPTDFDSRIRQAKAKQKLGIGRKVRTADEEARGINPQPPKQGTPPPPRAKPREYVKPPDLKPGGSYRVWRDKDTGNHPGTAATFVEKRRPATGPDEFVFKKTDGSSLVGTQFNLDRVAKEPTSGERPEDVYENGRLVGRRYPAGWQEEDVYENGRLVGRRSGPTREQERPRPFEFGRDLRTEKANAAHQAAYAAVDRHRATMEKRGDPIATQLGTLAEAVDVGNRSEVEDAIDELLAEIDKSSTLSRRDEQTLRDDAELAQKYAYAMSGWVK
jgi:hypothetical protein